MASDLAVFADTVSHRRPQRLLFYASMTPDLKRRVVEHIGTDDIAAHYGFFQPHWLNLRRPKDAAPLDFSRYWACENLPEGTTIDSRGVAMAPSGFYHFARYISPLRNAASLEEIEENPVDDESSWDNSHFAAAVSRAHHAGQVVSGWIGHMYEDAWQIRGYEQFLMDMLERPAWAECLLERLARRNTIRARAMAAAGADLIRCGDDVANQKAMMFSPQVWRKMMLSRWGEIWREVKEIHPAAKIWYHSDGNVAAIVDDLVAAGVDILNPLQPECLDVEAIHCRHRGRLSFDGCIGTQSTMPFGNAADVRQRVREVMDQFGCSGGLIISPTHVLEPEVPLENIDALAAACREYQTNTTEA